MHGSLGHAIFVAVLIVIAASFVVAPLEIGELHKGTIVAVVAALGGGILARLRGPLRWLVLLILPTMVVWGTLLVMFLAAYMFLAPDVVSD